MDIKIKDLEAETCSCRGEINAVSSVLDTALLCIYNSNPQTRGAYVLSAGRHKTRQVRNIPSVAVYKGRYAEKPLIVFRLLKVEIPGGRCPGVLPVN